MIQFYYEHSTISACCSVMLTLSLCHETTYRLSHLTEMQTQIPAAMELVPSPASSSCTIPRNNEFHHFISIALLLMHAVTLTIEAFEELFKAFTELMCSVYSIFLSAIWSELTSCSSTSHLERSLTCLFMRSAISLAFTAIFTDMASVLYYKAHF